MSLVHEALQKAEQEKHRKTGVPPVPPPPPPGPVVSASQPVTPVLPGTVKPAGHSPVLTAVVVGVGLVALVAIVWLVSRTATSYRPAEKAETTETVATPRPPASRATTPTTELSAPPAAAPLPPPSPYKLTGIMRDPDGKYVAVINGKVLAETQYVDGAVVKRIERDRVTLDVNGRDLVLRLF